MAVFTVSITYDYNDQTYTDLIFDSTDHTPAHNVISPVVKLELNKAGTLEFTAHPLLTSHDDTRQLFNHITPLNTFVTAKYDDIVIFHGRVLYCNTDFYRQKKVYCEGDLAFLVDSICNKFDYTGTGIKKSQLLTNLITAHNSQVETKKQLTVGIISAGDKDEVIKIKSDNYIETWSAIEQYVLKGSRGFIRTRYENGTTYIDWLAGWDRENETTGFGRTNTQRIEFGRNLLELDDGINANEIFTRLVPIGKDGLTIAVNPNDPIYMDITGGVQKYGYITRVKEFNDITDKAKLVEKATEYTYYALSGIEHTYSVKAVDLHLQDDTIMNYQLGDVVELYSPLQDIYKTKVIDGQTVSVGVKRVCTAVEYHLADIENTAYSFGIPENADPSESSASSHTSGSGKSTGSKTSSSASSQITTEKKESQNLTETYNWVSTRYDEHNNILQQAGISLNPDGVITYATDYEYNLRSMFKRVWIMLEDPTTQGYADLVTNGDVWIVSSGVQTWGQAMNIDGGWVAAGNLNWDDYAGCTQKIRHNGEWMIVSDYKQEHYNQTKIDQNAERIALLADNVEAYHAEFVVSANQIRSEVQDTNNAIGSRITQTATEIKSEVWASNSTMYSVIDQTATRIDMKVEAVNSSVAELVITASNIKSRVEDAEGNITTLTETAENITARVEDAEGNIGTLQTTANNITSRVEDAEGNIGTLQTTANNITSRVEDAEGNITTLKQTTNGLSVDIFDAEADIYVLQVTSSYLNSQMTNANNYISQLQQQANQIQASVEDAQSGVASLTLEAGSIRAYAGTKSRVWIQEKDPLLEGEDVHIGDYWIMSTGYRSWGSLNEDNKSWGWAGLHNSDSFNWEDYSGCPIYVLEGSSWTLVSDTRKLVENKTRLDITDEYIRALAKDVDNYRSEFEVRASQIRAEIHDTNNAIGSRVTQTAQKIKSEVWASSSQLYSTISQTATQIRAEVADSINGLSGEIDIQSSKISVVVESNGTGGYRPAVASIVASINNGDSSVKISANHIQLDAAHSLEFLASKMTLSSPSGGGIGVRYANGSEITGCETIQASKLWGLSSIEVGDSTANNKELLVHGLANVSGKVNISNASSSYNYALEVNGPSYFKDNVEFISGKEAVFNGTVTIRSNSGSWKTIKVLTDNDLNNNSRNFLYTGTGGQSNVLGKILKSTAEGTTIHYFGY